MVTLSARHEGWPIAGTFSISRGSKTVADVVLVEVTDGPLCGRGECVPYAHYGESIDSVLAQLESVSDALRPGVAPDDVQGLLPPGAARNALDCALWDLLAKRSGRRVWQLAELPAPAPVVTAYTLSLDSPERMGAAATASRGRALMKLKLAGEGDLERVARVREAAPDARLIVDANEGWRPEDVEPLSKELARLGVSLIEQPLPAAEDAVLADLPHPVPLCADESCHTREGLAQLVGRYEYVNVKLDKTGGLTEALALRREALAAGFEIMVGCMLGTSLGMAPAVLVAQGAPVVDLDGPLWLKGDREPGLAYVDSTVAPPEAALWG